MSEESHAKGPMVRESAWMRVYRTGPNELCYVSKFLTDSFSVSAAFVRKEWPLWTSAEQQEFANAFSARGSLTTDDQEILEFLMETGSDTISTAIAGVLPKYRDRDRALSFLMGRVAQKAPYAANFYQGLETMGDRRAVPLLEARYQEYRRSRNQFDRKNIGTELTNYLVCCRVLWKLSGSPEYENALREMLTHPDEKVRRRAEQLLSK